MNMIALDPALEVAVQPMRDAGWTEDEIRQGLKYDLDRFPMLRGMGRFSEAALVEQAQESVERAMKGVNGGPVPSPGDPRWRPLEKAKTVGLAGMTQADFDGLLALVTVLDKMRCDYDCDHCHY